MNKEKIAQLVANKKEIIELKKSALKFSDSFGISPFEVNTAKALNTSHTDDVQSGVIKRTIIGNTYNWLDSHGDVHLPGLFAKSISERTGRIWHLHDHEHKVTAKIGIPETITEQKIQWTQLGVQKFGYTEALTMESNIKKEMNSKMFKAYLNNEVDQHSVGMQYVKIEMAVNDPEYKDEYAVWVKYINDIGNKAEAEKQGYFYAIKEAKLIEISAVLEGSNSLTPAYQNITQPIEPEKSTQKSEPINYTYLINQLKS